MLENSAKCPHKKKKLQRHFHRWADLSTHTRKIKIRCHHPWDNAARRQASATTHSAASREPRAKVQRPPKNAPGQCQCAGGRAYPEGGILKCILHCRRHKSLAKNPDALDSLRKYKTKGISKNIILSKSKYDSKTRDQK